MGRIHVVPGSNIQPRAVVGSPKGNLSNYIDSSWVTGSAGVCDDVAFAARVCHDPIIDSDDI